MGSAAEPVSVDFRTLERHIGAGGFLTTLFMLEVSGRKTRVIPREVQVDPVSDRPVHVDFMRLAEGATVRLAIPVRFTGQGESPGLKKGGVLNVVRHEMEVTCPADNIPATIDVDVSALDINETLHISALKLPEGVKPTIRGRDFTVCSIVAPTSVIEEQRAAAAAAAARSRRPRHRGRRRSGRRRRPPRRCARRRSGGGGRYRRGRRRCPAVAGAKQGTAGAKAPEKPGKK